MNALATGSGLPLAEPVPAQPVPTEPVLAELLLAEPAPAALTHIAVGA